LLLSFDVNICENLRAFALHGLYNNMGNNGRTQYPLLPTRKSVVTLLNARRIDFHMSLMSLQGQLLKVEIYWMCVVCTAQRQSAGNAAFLSI
jgi:hypothetical protein